MYMSVIMRAVMACAVMCIATAAPLKHAIPAPPATERNANDALAPLLSHALEHGVAMGRARRGGCSWWDYKCKKKATTTTTHKPKCSLTYKSDGFCRTHGGGHGTSDKYSAYDVHECKDRCDRDANCVAVEFQAHKNQCELHYAPVRFYEPTNTAAGAACYSCEQMTSTGVAVPPHTISGEYIHTRYGARSNDWHFVTIAEVVVTGAAAGSSYTWTNKAGYSWALTRDNNDATLFHVGTTCPYYSTYKTARVATDSATGKPIGFYGPHNALYSIKSTVKASNPVFCPDGSTDATCWADSAFQKCPQNRQGAYDKVMVAKTGGQDAMHEAFRTLVGGEYGCTKPAKRDKHTSCPRWTQYCTRGAWVSWMAVNCPATCNSGRV